MSECNPILAIIGTAGRKDDAPLLTRELWHKTKVIVDKFIKDYGITSAISGGAAWADHLAVEAFNSPRTHIAKLYLELPCLFNLETPAYFDNGERGFQDNPGNTCNYYHKKFSQAMNRNSLEDLRIAILNKNCETNVGGGFFHRNAAVAAKADMLLAITFGDKELLKDGGTAHTTGLFIKNKGNDMAFHIDLNSVQLYKGARI